MSDEEHCYDLSWEMRRMALSEDFEKVTPLLRTQLVEALSTGQRIWFAPDDEAMYVERKLDRVFRDPGQGRPVGGQRI